MVKSFKTGLATHSWASQEIINFSRKHKSTIKFEGIQTKLFSLGAPNEDNGRTIANNYKRHLIGQ